MRGTLISEMNGAIFGEIVSIFIPEMIEALITIPYKCIGRAGSGKKLGG